MHENAMMTLYDGVIIAIGINFFMMEIWWWNHVFTITIATYCYEIGTWSNCPWFDHVQWCKGQGRWWQSLEPVESLGTHGTSSCAQAKGSTEMRRGHGRSRLYHGVNLHISWFKYVKIVFLDSHNMLHRRHCHLPPVSCPRRFHPGVAVRFRPALFSKAWCLGLLHIWFAPSSVQNSR